MEVPPPSSIRPDVPPELDRIVARALARDPAERYATGQALADDLDRVLEALRYQPRALPDLLHELFGAELTSRQIPTTTLTTEMLAACRAESSSSGAQRRPSATDPTPLARRARRPSPTSTASRSGRGRRSAPPSRWLSWVAASDRDRHAAAVAGGARRGRPFAGGDAAAARRSLRVGGGGARVRAHAGRQDRSAALGRRRSRRSRRHGTAGSPRIGRRARPGHRARWSGKGRIARGLSVDPFAEAASRVGR